MNCNNFTKKEIKEEIKEEIQKTIKEIQAPISITMLRKRNAKTNEDPNKKSKVKITIDKIDLAKARTAQIDWTTEKGRGLVEDNWFSLNLNDRDNS